MSDAARSVRRHAAWLAALVLMMTAAAVLFNGCTATVIAPASVHEPVAVYVLEYGRHPSLVLPRSDAHLVEYSYGEWQWYAMNRTGFFDVFRALFISSPAALGRREILRPHPDAKWWEDVAAVNLHLVMVERALADDLLQDLDGLWKANRHTAVHNHVRGLEMVHHPQPYNAFTNSNILLARWLEDLDCTVRGWPLYPMRWRVVEE